MSRLTNDFWLYYEPNERVSCYSPQKRLTESYWETILHPHSVYVGQLFHMLDRHRSSHGYLPRPTFSCSRVISSFFHFLDFRSFLLCAPLAVVMRHRNTHFTSLSLDTALCGEWHSKSMIIRHSALYLFLLGCLSFLDLLFAKPTCFSVFKTTPETKSRNGQKV